MTTRSTGAQPARAGGTWTRRLVSFPNPVNEISARLVAGGVVLMSLAALVLDWDWLAVVLAYGFVARVLTGPTLSPLGQLVTRVVTPRLNVPPRHVPGPPKRFAQGIGAAFTTTAAILALTGHDLAADVMLWVIVVFATLESGFGFCMGCWFFTRLIRLGVIPQAVCEACADISLRRRPASG
jgi:hypothetical protein